MVAMVMMGVMTLIVLGFAEVSRHNEREALDRQLSSQAFYAAESGVNDAQDAINTVLNNPTVYPNPGAALTKTNCGNGVPAPAIYGTKTSTLSPGVSYTCLLVDTNPPSLLYGLSSNSGSRIIPIQIKSGNIATLQVQWQAGVSGPTPLANCPDISTANQLPSAGTWNCGFAALRVDIVDTSGSYTSSTLQARTSSVILMPSTIAGATSIAYKSGSNNLYGNAANQGAVVGTQCTNGPAGRCLMTFTNMGGASYYMRVTSLYQNAQLQLTAQSATGTTLRFANAQALVDATGKAQDVLRRIQVRVPTANNGGIYGDYAIESDGPICKQLVAQPGGTTDACPGVLPGGIIIPPVCVAQPNDIALVLDNSHSMVNPVDDWNGAHERNEVVSVVTKFVNKTAGPVNHEAIIGFNQVATVYTPMTGTLGAVGAGGLLDGINKYNSFNPKSGTSDYSNWFGTWYVSNPSHNPIKDPSSSYIDPKTALPIAKQVLNGATVRNGFGVHKIMVFISDGVANDYGAGANSVPLYQTQLRKAVDKYVGGNLSDVQVLTFGINNNPDSSQGQILSSMSNPGLGLPGGQYYSADSTGLFEKFIDDLANGLNCT